MYSLEKIVVAPVTVELEDISDVFYAYVF
jgi:hypothetical protein